MLEELSDSVVSEKFPDGPSEIVVDELENSMLVEERAEVLLSLIKEILDEKVEFNIVKLVLVIADVLDSIPNVVLSPKYKNSN